MSDLRRASTVCLVRDAPHLEVLMVQRPDTSRFMPGVWVFPGGVVDPTDREAPAGFGDADDWRVAAIRELIEETGIWLTAEGAVQRQPTDAAFDAVASAGVDLAPNTLVYFANWITPSAFPLRFDTRFYLGVVDESTRGTVDGEELVDLDWVGPLEALAREERGDWDIAFPTRKVLEVLARGTDARSLAADLERREMIPAVEPRLYVGPDEARIVLPGEDLFSDIEEDQGDPDLLHRLAAVVEGGGRVPAEFKRRS